MLKKPKDKKELLSLLQAGRDFRVIAVGWGKKKDILEEMRKLDPQKEASAIIIEFR